MKIAVIGSGVSGLVSAYLLARDHEVKIFEADNRLGGHAHTITVDANGQKIGVDNGFMVFNPVRYPHFVKLLERLDVESVETTMSFAVSIPGEVRFEGSFPGGFFADKKNLFSIRYWKFLFGILKLRKAAKQKLQQQTDAEETLSAFLQRNDIHSDVAQWFLYPMLSAIWSVKDAIKAGDFPALATFTFMDNHQLLSQNQPRWRTVKGGSKQYVAKIEAYLREQGSEIVLNAPVVSVRRIEDHVEIESNGTVEYFDYVLFATHADTTLQLLADASEEEKTALGRFHYTINTTVLHNDSSILPDKKRLLAAWNYSVAKPAEQEAYAVFTYCMNILQHIDKKVPVYVTLNPPIQIPPEKVYAQEIYSHPQYSIASLQGQAELKVLQGQRHTLFTGAHLGYGFHEDGVQSAIDAVDHLGVHTPWEL